MLQSLEKHLFYTFLFSIFCNIGYSQNIEAQFDFAQFQNQKSTFIETYISINAKSVHFTQNENNNFQASVLINMVFSSQDTIYLADKYLLSSPELIDTSDIDFVFIDQQRYFLEDGIYTLSIDIGNPQMTSNKISHQEIIRIKKKDGFSDIQFIESYSESSENNILSKSGFDLVPFISNFYNENNDTLRFYFEYYNTTEQSLLLQTKIISHSTNQLVNNLAFSKKTKEKRTPILGKMALNQLPTGSYYLYVTALTVTNEQIDSTQKLFFKINDNFLPKDTEYLNTFASTITNKDSLKLYIDYLYPIQSTSESIYADNQLSIDSLEIMQKYFFEFWKRRDPFNTESSWLRYLETVRVVNTKFGNGLRPGYLTDRGRIYLSHGSPNSISEEFLPKQYHPFEVWHYYKIDDERNIKFVFSNDRMPNEFRLVFSNKQGETSSRSDWLERFNKTYHDDHNIVNDSPFDYFKNPK